MTPEHPIEVPPALMAHLASIYPDRCPSLGTSMEAIWYAAGQAAVVRYLANLVEEQQSNALPEATPT